MGVADWVRGRLVAFDGLLANIRAERCELPWHPSAFAPVFSGFRDYSNGLVATDELRLRALVDRFDLEFGAPTPLRVWFPSVGGSPATNEILRPCGQYPLVVVAHGMCGIGTPPSTAAQNAHYLTWAASPLVRQLGRAGYVVAIPQLDGINFSPDGDAVLIRRVIDWMHDGWEHSSVLTPPERTAVIGHSRGAVNAAHVAAGGGIGAFVWLSGDTFAVTPEDLLAIQVPKLFVFGETEALDRSWAPPVDGATRPSGTWQQFSLPRHAALLHGLEHFDYLAPNVSPCAAKPGPCAHVGRAVADLVTLFLGRHLAGTPTPATPEIPRTLLVPDDWDDGLTLQQAFFAGSYLTGHAAWAHNGTCRLDVSFDDASGSGVASLPDTG